MTDDSTGKPREKKVPQGRIGRMARLAGVGLRSGAAALLGKQSRSAADHAADVLGTLRGLAAKVGQMASYVDGIVPEAQRDSFESALSHLRAQAPTSPFDEVMRTVEDDLGSPLDSLFASFEPQPIASASIGQVHRATLRGGQLVAVKVQHAGIAEAVESDLKNAGLVEMLAGSVMGKRFDTGAMLETIRTRFREELDYGLEARRIDIFRAVHAHDPSVYVPACIPTHSSRRVLTTEFADGGSFEEACRAPAPERRLWAETLWRFVFRGNLVGGHFNADPHPGNYIFRDGGAVAFVDFGCVQPIGERRLRHARDVHRAAVAGDEHAFRAAVRALLLAPQGTLSERAIDYTRRCFDPLFQAPFRVTREYAASLLGEMQGLGKLARQAPDEEFFTMPAEMVFINRLQFGFYSVLARLDVEADYKSVEEVLLREIPS